eukprot:2544344-Rhodomonas_salina.1
MHSMQCVSSAACAPRGERLPKRGTSSSDVADSSGTSRTQQHSAKVEDVSPAEPKLGKKRAHTRSQQRAFAKQMMREDKELQLEGQQL